MQLAHHSMCWVGEHDTRQHHCREKTLHLRTCIVWCICSLHPLLHGAQGSFIIQQWKKAAAHWIKGAMARLCYCLGRMHYHLPTEKLNLGFSEVHGGGLTSSQLELNVKIHMYSPVFLQFPQLVQHSQMSVLTGLIPLPSSTLNLSEQGWQCQLFWVSLLGHTGTWSAPQAPTTCPQKARRPSLSRHVCWPFPPLSSFPLGLLCLGETKQNKIVPLLYLAQPKAACGTRAQGEEKWEQEGNLGRCHGRRGLLGHRTGPSYPKMCKIPEKHPKPLKNTPAPTLPAAFAWG